MTSNGLASLWRKVLQFQADRRGIGAVEFAFIAPLLLCLYFMSMETSLAVEANKKVGRIGSMVADLITQQPGTISRTNLEGIMQLAEAVIKPYDRTKPKIVVTAIKVVDDDLKTQVAWSRQGIDGNYTTPYARDSSTTLPERLKTKGAFVIRVESSLDYKPLITWNATQKESLGLASAFDSISMGGTYYLRPRMSATISCDDC